MIKLLPTTPEDYEKSNTTHLGNFKEWSTLMSKYRQEQNYDLYQDILDDNRATFKAILGDRGCEWEGYVKWDVWKLEVTPKTSLFVLSSEQGSCFELGGDTADIGQAIQIVEEIKDLHQQNQIDVNH